MHAHQPCGIVMWCYRYGRTPSRIILYIARKAACVVLRFELLCYPRLASARLLLIIRKVLFLFLGLLESGGRWSSPSHHHHNHHHHAGWALDGDNNTYMPCLYMNTPMYYCSTVGYYVFNNAMSYSTYIHTTHVHTAHTTHVILHTLVWLAHRVVLFTIFPSNKESYMSQCDIHRTSCSTAVASLLSTPE